MSDESAHSAEGEQNGEGEQLEQKVQDPRIGQVVQDRYRIVRRLGEGGMGIVYEGEHLMIKRRVAIKLLHAQFASDPMVVKRFHNEAIAATSIGNAHIVEVTDMGRLEDGTFFMVLEFLEGHDFDHLIETEGPQPVGRVVHIVSQACEALQGAHDKGIVHRDLKPENLYLIERSGDPHFVKVLDFGIAKFKENKDDSMTQTGQTIGTPHYMSPEQLQGSKDLDARADLYALGVIMYHALTGRHPFEAETFPLLVMKIFNEAPVPLTTFRQDVPPGLVQIIDHLLAKHPSQRYQSAQDLRAALAPFREVATQPDMVANAPGVGAVSGTSVPATQALYASGPQVTPGQFQAGSAPQVAQGGFQTGSGPMAQTMHAPAPSSKLPMIVALASLLLAGGVGAALLLGQQSSPEVQTTPVTQQAPDDDDDPELHSVTIRTVPPRQPRLLLDGDPVANPFISELPASREGYRIEARLDGYESATQTFSLRSPQEIILTLERRDAGAAAVAEADTDDSEAGDRRGRRGRRTGRAGRRAGQTQEQETSGSGGQQAQAEVAAANTETEAPSGGGSGSGGSGSGGSGGSSSAGSSETSTGPTKRSGGLIRGISFD